MRHTGRSDCPINLALELLGDRWNLIVIRDIMLANRRSYGELLAKNIEGIASNILADRLKRLTASGLLTRVPDPAHRQKSIYSLTEPAIQLLPLIVQLGSWGNRHLEPGHALSLRARLLEEGGPDLWHALMDELRFLHLGAPEPERSVYREFQDTYREALAAPETQVS